MSAYDVNKFLQKHPVLTTALNGMHDMALILNESRRIVYYNDNYKTFATQNGLNLKTGVLPGNAFNCVNAVEGDKACGTTDFCIYCNANLSLKRCLDGADNTSECQIVSLNGNAFNLHVSASELLMEDSRYILYCLQDVSGETRRRMLEKIFFHDINNIVGGISLIGDMLLDNCDSQDEDNISNFKLLLSAVDTLKNEIHAQRIISMAEKDELDVKPKETCLKDMLDKVVAFFKRSTADNGIEIQQEIHSHETCITTDPLLLQRVIVNMVKNACEASTIGQKVKIQFSHNKDSVIIHVHNESFMPDKVSKSIFKRSFSTKGEGRGLGTYSMRLLTERYLQGSIYFTTFEDKGTTFYLELPLTLQD